MIHKIIGLFALFVVCSAQKMPVTIYYESLCPDSQAFITQQVYPEMKMGLSEHVDITWVPFGKSSFETRGSDVMFTCHHGPNECYGNKVQSCAIQHIQVNSYQNEHNRQSLTLEYINCLMKIGKNFPDDMYPGEKCAAENRLENWQVIAQCANSTEGSQLLKKNGELTNALQMPLASVPTVTFNYQYDPDIQAAALTNFRSVVCKQIKFPQPKLCAKGNGANGIVYTPMALLAAFILSRMF